MSKFNEWQLREIQDGEDLRLDTSIYADPKYSENQMREIKYGLIKNLDVSIYARGDFDWRQMAQIRYGLEAGVDVSIYANPHYTREQMQYIRWGLEEGLNANVYANPEFDEDRMGVFYILLSEVAKGFNYIEASANLKRLGIELEISEEDWNIAVNASKVNKQNSEKLEGAHNELNNTIEDLNKSFKKEANNPFSFIIGEKGKGCYSELIFNTRNYRSAYGEIEICIKEYDNYVYHYIDLKEEDIENLEKFVKEIKLTLEKKEVEYTLKEANENLEKRGVELRISEEEWGRAVDASKGDGEGSKKMKELKNKKPAF